MTTNEITKFLSAIDDLNRKASGNSRTRIFTQRARELVVKAYRMDWTTKVYTAREGADTSQADKLIAFGIEQAIYGAGRNLLHD
mgnify:CR=1 FL=1